MDAKELGRAGEAMAADYLEARGWTILARNVRHGRKEVDLVVKRGGVLAFVEVKCRRGRGHGHPMEAITHHKQREIAHVARGWLRGRTIPPSLTIRFDAVAVYRSAQGWWKIDHLPDAWRL